MKNQLKKLVDLKSLPKNKARVEIAKDVIAALKAGSLSAKQGYYLSMRHARRGSLRKQLSGNVCEVCAIGACFTAAVARVNAFELADFELTATGGAYVEDRTMAPTLYQFFSKKQIDLIECAFEVTFNPINNIGKGEKTVFDTVKAGQFGDKYADPTRRMVAIMQNIVDNDGKFVP